MSDQPSELRAELIARQLATRTVAAPDGRRSLIMHDNEEAADRALEIVQPIADERDRLRDQLDRRMVIDGQALCDRLADKIRACREAIEGDGPGDIALRRGLAIAEGLVRN